MQRIRTYGVRADVSLLHRGLLITLGKKVDRNNQNGDNFLNYHFIIRDIDLRCNITLLIDYTQSFLLLNFLSF